MRRLFQDIASELELHNQIREIVADYCADHAQQIAPKTFRADLRTFETALKTFLTKFPEPSDSLTEALNQELNKLDDDAAPDTEYIRRSLDTLREAVNRLAVDEGGPGRDANRAKHLLISGLAHIFEDRTGRSAISSFHIDQTYEGDNAVRGPFADFVKGVNENIPDRYRLVGLETLFRSLRPIPQAVKSDQALATNYAAPESSTEGAEMWKPKHRRAAERPGLRYPSDLTDPEWTLVEPMIPPAKRGGRRREVNVREVLNAVLYVLSTGCKWQTLPKDLPPKSTAHSYFTMWDRDGTLERLRRALYASPLVRAPES